MTLMFSGTRRGTALTLAVLLGGQNLFLARLSSVQRTNVQETRSDPRSDWIEPDAPFFSSVLDAGKSGFGPSRNVTPRGLVLKLGGGYWAGFDTDLLRVAAIWNGKAVTAKALAPGSYHVPDRKTPLGQSPLPEPDGRVWLVNGIYPGWQTGERPALEDPREPAPSPEEVGRGPLAEETGRFKAVHLVRDGAVLEYTAGGSDVREWMTAAERDGRTVVERHFQLGPAARPLWLVLGVAAGGRTVAVSGGEDITPSLEKIALGAGSEQVWVARLPKHDRAVSFSATLAEGDAVAAVVRPIPAQPIAPRWTKEVTSKVTRSTSTAAYVIDDIGLPLQNPWHRAVRPGDVQFLPDGTGAIVTLDGDVWLVRGLQERTGVVRWRRFASGLHEPLTLAVRDGQIYVFDRNGIWRLRDTDGDGEADVHELFSNAFAQTADMREFPNTLRLAPRGEFVIAKGGQEATTIGKHNGSVLRVSADGRHATLLGYGLRQPNLGVNVRTGLVTASDQQGNYIPSTPLHVIRDRQFYGFLSDKRPREVYPAPIAEPMTWIPHPINASAMSQVWLFDAKMGPLTDAMVHIGFNRPELFRVLLNERGAKPQAAVVSVTRAFDYPPLNGSVNPVDGQLYIAGFQILGWGTTAPRMEGLGRVRYTGAASTVPSELVPMDAGVLLRFDVPLARAKALDPASYAITSWHYQRTYKYGSPQLRADGSPGIDRVAASAAYLSKDGKSVFIGVPGMKPVMQLHVGWTLASAAGKNIQGDAYTTSYDLPKFDPRAEGFGDLTVDLTTKRSVSTTSTPVSAEEGGRLSQLYGCIACHGVNASSAARFGPRWTGLYGSQRTFGNNVPPAVADEAYLRESILEPTAKVVSGFEKGEFGMPSYAGVLTDAQIESVILFIKSLK
jgi:glucose/arabinose dehydrogenase/mono/diheme cytochrome c family protein